jgi:hypothetical protein
VADYVADGLWNPGAIMAVPVDTMSATLPRKEIRAGEVVEVIDSPRN